MKFLLTYFFLFITACLSAQTLTRSVIGSAGHSLSNSDVTVGFTIGEPLIGLIANETSINQGFWAGSLIVEAITEEEDLDGILVYPNPVDDELTIYTNNKKIFGVTLFSVNGQRALKQNLESTKLEHRIDLSYVAKGIYVLRLYVEGDNKGKLFKIIKR